ncbi:MAG: hypothetical protein OXC14_05240 [Rhodospirillaceae bacterium]|nr:hypothetical protein [Rhodospirillaceae bacterium]
MEFQVIVELERTEQTTAVALEAAFDLSDPDLLELVRQEKAEYALLVVSPLTRLRKELRSGSDTLKEIFEDGELGGEVELRPFLLATKDIPGFLAEHWNRDYAGRRFDIRKGAVLATDTPYRSWVDVEDEGPIGSMFQLAVDEELEEGIWGVGLDSDRIQVLVTKSDSKLLEAVRGQAKTASDWAYLMNGLYLPALIYALTEAGRSDAEQVYGDRRWYSSLQARLEQIGAPSLESQTTEDRARDAQRLLDLPFSKLLSRLRGNGAE